jgi:hypothetical protein
LIPQNLSKKKLRQKNKPLPHHLTPAVGGVEFFSSLHQPHGQSASARFTLVKHFLTATLDFSTSFAIISLMQGGCYLSSYANSNKGYTIKVKRQPKPTKEQKKVGRRFAAGYVLLLMALSAISYVRANPDIFKTESVIVEMIAAPSGPPGSSQ